MENSQPLQFFISSCRSGATKKDYVFALEKKYYNFTCAKSLQQLLDEARSDSTLAEKRLIDYVIQLKSKEKLSFENVDIEKINQQLELENRFNFSGKKQSNKGEQTTLSDFVN